MSQLDWTQTSERLALARMVTAMCSGTADHLISTLDESGIPWIGIPEVDGGSGGDDADLAVAMQVLAGEARDASLSETGFVSAWALRQCGHAEPNCHIAPAFDIGTELTAVRRGGDWHISGRVRRVPGMSGAQFVLLPVQAESAWHLALLPASAVDVTVNSNLAGEARADLKLDESRAERLLDVPSHLAWLDLHARLALARSVQISGALRATCDLTVNYARTREQFGKPIAEQQAVAHMLASIAEQSLLAEAAVATAMHAPTLWYSAIAKSVTSRAARSAAATAHQVHGAMGMSLEYPLGRLTTRLWSWAEEGGRPEAWEAWLGSQFMQQDQPQLWESIVNAMEGTHQ